MKFVEYDPCHSSVILHYFRFFHTSSQLLLYNYNQRINIGMITFHNYYYNGTYTPYTLKRHDRNVKRHLNFNEIF